MSLSRVSEYNRPIPRRRVCSAEDLTDALPRYADIPGHQCAERWEPGKAASRMTRWTVDMASPRETFESAQRLSEFVGEFPKIDDRYQTEAYRHGWLLGFDPGRSSLGHVDHQTGTTSVWQASPHTALQEPCFIPRSNTAAEGDGYIIQLATLSDEMRTAVYLFEALRIQEGPFATIRLPLRLRPGYHGNWAPHDQIGA